jgi:hypothetical protein
LEDGGLQQRS